MILCFKGLHLMLKFVKFLSFLMFSLTDLPLSFETYEQWRTEYRGRNLLILNFFTVFFLGGKAR